MSDTSQPSDAIEPDTKDWTWVLDEACPECGFRADAVAAEDIPGLVRDSIPRWEAVLERPGATTRPSPGVWSPTEYACHVRDVFDVFARRARLMLEQDSPEFENWDQDETAVAERYDLQEPARVAPQLRTAGEDAAAVFAGVPAGSWDRPGLRSNGSRFTVLSLGRYFVHDVVHHLHDVRG